MEDRPEYLEGKEFIFEYGPLRLLPLDQMRKDEFGDTIATEQRAYRRERIVRCRDCKNYRPAEDDEHEDGCALAYAYLFETSPDGFCAWGEEKGNE